MEILFVTIVDRKIEIHTTAGIFTGSTMEQLERILSMRGFIKVDQNTIANLDKATSFCPAKRKILYKNGQSCTVSIRNFRKVSTFFDKRKKS